MSILKGIKKTHRVALNENDFLSLIRGECVFRDDGEVEIILKKEVGFLFMLEQLYIAYNDLKEKE